MFGCCNFLMSMKLCLRKMMCYLSTLNVLTAKSLPDYLLKHFLTTPCAPSPILSPRVQLSLNRESGYSSCEVQLAESARSLSNRGQERESLLFLIFSNLVSICMVVFLMIGTALSVWRILLILRLRCSALLDYIFISNHNLSF